MRKNLLTLDLQHFADEIEDAGENDVEEPAPSQEEETSEDEESETVEENDGNDEPHEQTPEENARYAAIRRRAEEDARRRYEGEMNAMSTTTPASLSSFAASDTRRMFSARSSAEKPRLAFRPMRKTKVITT